MMTKISMSEAWFTDCVSCLRVLGILFMMIDDERVRGSFMKFHEFIFDFLYSRVSTFPNSLALKDHNVPDQG